MKKVIALMFIICSMSLISCEKSGGTLCGGIDPVANMPWLKQKISQLSTSAQCQSISRSTYKSQTVFILSNCDPLANSIPLLYDCQGIQLNLTQADYQELKFTGNIELIWKSN